jgi:hypothetical protein
MYGKGTLHKIFPREAHVESELSLQTRREFLQQMIPQYRKATTVKKKSKLLDAFTTTTGYNRKYPMWLLNHAQVGQPAPQHPRPRHYGPEVQHALFLVWHAANRICAKRLMPFLPTFVEAVYAAWVPPPRLRSAAGNCFP